jgi:hypothetical protein
MHLLIVGYDAKFYFHYIIRDMRIPAVSVRLVTFFF